VADRTLTDLELERWLAEDLPAERARAATAADRARLEELRGEHAAFLASVDVGAEIRAIGQRVARAARAGQEPRIATRRTWLVSGGALAAAALVIVLALRGRRPDPDDDLRPKGGSIGLVIHVATGSGSQPIAGADPVHPGDRIRFEVSVPGPGYLAVVGIDSSGTATVYYPFGGTAPAKIDAGAGAVLPGGVELDATLGDEQIYAVYAAQTFALDDALFAGLRGSGPGRPVFATARVVLHKLK
jgi:hypothetical protein